MRAFGSPSASTVASVMAVGSRGSEAVASSSQAANSRNGSSAAVKSPLVNQLGCSIGSRIRHRFRSARVAGAVSRCSSCRLYSGCARARLWRALPLAAALTLALAGGGCSISYRPIRFAVRQLREIRRHRLDHAAARRQGSRPDCRPTAIWPMRARRPPTCSPAAARTPARPGKTRAPARAAPSPRSPPPIPRTARPAGISWRAMSRAASQSWMQGEACKQDKGVWEIRALKPWKRS